MSIKFELASFELGGVQPYGWGSFPGKFLGKIIGHEFTMVGLIKLVDKWNIGRGKTVSALPKLQWREREFWWDGSSGRWEFKGETDKGDLYASSPTSPTWAGFAQGKVNPSDHNWLVTPALGIDLELRPKLLSGKQQICLQEVENDLRLVQASKKHMDLVQEERAARGQRMWALKDEIWFLCAEKIAANNHKVPCAALDRPGMALSGGTGASGGGFTSLSTSETRRRVLQFDLGAEGCPARFTATQILEVQDGQPSISKFFYPGKSDDWCRNIPEDYLAYWRSRLNMANVNDQTYLLESQQTVNEWVDWARRMDAVAGRRT